MGFFSKLFVSKADDFVAVGSYYKGSKVTTKEYEMLVVTCREHMSRLTNWFRGNMLVLKFVLPDGRQPLINQLAINVAKIEIVTRRAFELAGIKGDFATMAKMAIFFISDVLLMKPNVCSLEKILDLALMDENVMSRLANIIRLRSEGADYDAYMPSHLALLECYGMEENVPNPFEDKLLSEDILNKANAFVLVVSKQMAMFRKADAIVAPEITAMTEETDASVDAACADCTATEEDVDHAETESSYDDRGSLRRLSPAQENETPDNDGGRRATAELASTAVLRGSLPECSDAPGKVEKLPTETGRAGPDATSKTAEVSVLSMGLHSERPPGDDSRAERPDAEMGLSGRDSRGAPGAIVCGDVQTEPIQTASEGRMPGVWCGDAVNSRASAVLDALRCRRKNSVARVLDAANTLCAIDVVGESDEYVEAILVSWMSLSDELFDIFRIVNAELQQANLDSWYMNATDRLKIGKFGVLMTSLIGVRENGLSLDTAASALKGVLRSDKLVDGQVHVRTRNSAAVFNKEELLNDIIESFWVGIPKKKLPNNFNPQTDPSCLAVAIELLEKAKIVGIKKCEPSAVRDGVWKRLYDYSLQAEAVLSNPKKAAKNTISFVPIWERKQFARQFAVAMSMIGINVNLHSLDRVE